MRLRFSSQTDLRRFDPPATLPNEHMIASGISNDQPRRGVAGDSHRDVVRIDQTREKAKNTYGIKHCIVCPIVVFAGDQRIPVVSPIEMDEIAKHDEEIVSESWR